MSSPSPTNDGIESSAGFTRGPWYFDGGADWTIYGADGTVVAEVYTSRADTKLMTAAPDLATALVNAAAMCAVYADFIRHHVCADEVEVHPYLPALEDVIDNARAALAKARGQ